MQPVISIIIPTYNTQEATLNRCLQSICSQTDGAMECIVVDDGSKPSCKETVDRFMQCDERIRYIRLWKNSGILEARRAGCKKARGSYILAVDADDELSERTACEQLYEAAQKENADIVQCSSFIIIPEHYNNIKKYESMQRGQIPHEGVLHGKEIFENMCINNGHSSFLWGKLIKKSLYNTCYTYIPHMYCVQSEDFIQYFFISFFAQGYVGIPQKLYTYYLGEGISTVDSITSTAKWKIICSTSKIFNVLYDFIHTHPEAQMYHAHLVKIEQAHLYFILRRFHTIVASDIKEEAWSILCNTWGTQKVFEFNEIVQKRILNTQ